MLTLLRPLWLALLVSATGLLLASSAHALPSISLDEPIAEPAADECPLLTRIKYPWLACTTTADGRRIFAGGTVPANATWESERQIPLGFEWIEGLGAYLPITQLPR